MRSTCQTKHVDPDAGFCKSRSRAKLVRRQLYQIRLNGSRLGKRFGALGNRGKLPRPGNSICHKIHNMHTLLRNIFRGLRVWASQNVLFDGVKYSKKPFKKQGVHSNARKSHDILLRARGRPPAKCTVPAFTKNLSLYLTTVFDDGNRPFYSVFLQKSRVFATRIRYQPCLH